MEGRGDETINWKDVNIGESWYSSAVLCGECSDSISCEFNISAQDILDSGCTDTLADNFNGNAFSYDCHIHFIMSLLLKNEDYLSLPKYCQ